MQLNYGRNALILLVPVLESFYSRTMLAPICRMVISPQQSDISDALGPEIVSGLSILLGDLR